MRNVPNGFSTLTTLCYVWRLTRKDNVQIGFTDHDQTLDFNGLSCAPTSGFNGGDIDQNIGFAANTGSVEGILDSEKITAQDIRMGAFDGALIETFRVNWKDRNQFVKLARGFVGNIRKRGDVFEAEWRGDASLLERSTGRVFSLQCDAAFGDARCGVNVANFPSGTRCARTYAMCRDQFSNTDNFRGFPYLLGDDSLLAVSTSDDIRDGGSRYDV